MHYVGNKKLLRNYRSHRGIDVGGLGGSVSVMGVGDLYLTLTCTDGTKRLLIIHDVFYIENCDSLILSQQLFLSQFESIYGKIELKSTGTTSRLKITEDERVGIVNMDVSDNLVLLPAVISTLSSSRAAKRRRSDGLRGGDNDTLVTSKASVYATARGGVGGVDCSVDYAHIVLCHPSERKMAAIRNFNLVRGLTWRLGEKLKTCYPCAIGKSKLNNKRHSSTVYTKRGELIVTDIEGAVACKSFAGGYEFAVHFTDMYSRFSVVYFMKRKSEVGAKFDLYLKDHCDPKGIVVQTVQNDGAGEYVGDKSAFKKLCKQRKIDTKSSSPYCHWENGVAERVIRTMMEKSFACMAQRALVPQYWAMCLEHVYQVENFLPHSAFDNKESPYMRWHGKQPDLSGFRPFGCDVRVDVPRDHPDYNKYLNPPAWIGIYVGEKPNGATHLVYRQGEHGAAGKVKDIGDRLCTFFDSYDDKLYLRTKDDKVYRDYLKYGESDPAAPSIVPQRSEFRIAKRFGSRDFFGTAKANDEPGEFEYDVRYDDGDAESMSQFEIDKAKKLFKELCDKDPRAQFECDLETYTVLPGKIKLLEIIDHKIVVLSTNNVIAVVKCKYEFTVSGVTTTRLEYVAVGALLSYCVDFDKCWSLLRNYVARFYSSEDDDSKFHKELFRFVRLERGRAVRRSTTLGFMTYEYDPDSETVHCFSADIRKPVFKDTSKLKAFISASDFKIPMTLESTDVYVPTKYSEVLKLATDAWRRATDVCIFDLGLADVGDWVRISDVPRGSPPISSRFVYQVKTRAGGRFEAFCRWTPRGFEEQPLKHYDPDNIFAGTPQLWCLRTILVKALTAGWKTTHLDFKRAFSHAPIDRPVYVTLPPNYHKYDEEGYELCLRLRKSSEGLKQSAAQWDQLLTKFLLKHNFEKCASDQRDNSGFPFEQCDKEPHLWRSKVLSTGNRAFMCIYVDDIYLTTDDNDWLKSFRVAINELAPHKSLGEITYALGCEIEHTKGVTTISCKRKITELLRRARMEDCTGAVTPLIPNSTLSSRDFGLVSV